MYEDAISNINFSDDEDDVKAIVNASAIAMELTQNSSSKINIYVSSPFYNPKEKATSYVVLHGNAEHKRSPFYFYKENIQKSMADINAKKFAFFKEPESWVSYITNFKIRRNPHDEDSKYKRNEKGYPLDMFGYAVQVKGKLSNDEILKRETLRFKFFFQEPVITEERALKKCEALLELNKTSSINLYNWLIDQKGKDEKTAAKIMSKEVSTWVRDGAIYHKKVPLDRFLVDYDIRSFLIQHLSCGGWDDLTDSDKKHCFKHYPRKQLPDWETITKEDYQLGIRA